MEQETVTISKEQYDVMRTALAYLLFDRQRDIDVSAPSATSVAQEVNIIYNKRYNSLTVENKPKKDNQVLIF